MANTTYYVDTDIETPGDGSSWAQAFDALSTYEALGLNLTTGATQGISTVHCKGATADVGGFTWGGWTTSATEYIHVVVDAADRHAGVYDASKYHIVGADIAALQIRDDHIRLEGLQIIFIWTAANTAVLKVNTIQAGSDIRVSHCIIDGGGEGGIEVGDADTNIKIFNNIIYNANRQAADNGIVITAGTADIWNNTIVDCNNGIKQTGGTVNVDMNLVSDCGDAFNGTFASGEHNAYTEGADPANNGHSVTRGVEFEFAGYAGDDFHIDASFDGTTDQSGGIVTDDIDGDARSGTFDIGADEFIAAPAEGNIIPIIDHHNRMMAMMGS